jgi:Flp pilus assembly protein TadG
MLRNFCRKEDGGVAMIFAFSIIPILYFVGAAVDYRKLLADRAQLQSGADSAALAISSEIASSYIANGKLWPTALTTYQAQANTTVSAQTGGTTQTPGFGSVSTNNVYICTPSSGQCSVTYHGNITSLQPGQVAVIATGTQSRIFGNISLLGETSSSLSAMSVAGAQSNTTYATQPSPSSVTFQFQYAKGWWYKVVTLWVLPKGAGTPLAMGTWTYQATNLNTIAVPSTTASTTPSLNDIDAILIANDNFPTNPSDGGIGTVTTSWNTSNASSINATINTTTNQITFTEAYDDLYLTMDVADQQCPLGQYYNAVSQSNPMQWWFDQWYWNAGQVALTVGCQNNNRDNQGLTSYTFTAATNNTAHSEYIYINGAEQPAGTSIGIGTAFPCPSNPAPGQTATTYYSWEDYNNNGGDRDYFFSMTTTCAPGFYTGYKPVATTSATAAALVH